MATNDELNNRLLIVEQTIANAVLIPTGCVEVNDVKITDKTGWLVFGQIAGIHSGKNFSGISIVATPTLDAHIDPFTYREL